MISVIVPIYNVSKYLKKCIESILSQTYKTMEIILVDDGSTDESASICDNYAQNDERIVVIHKTNGGLVSARKAGLEISRGEFICWVDGDDYIEPDYYEKMIDVQNSTGVDFVSSSHFHDIGEDCRKVYDNFPLGVYTGEMLIPRLMYSGVFFEYGIQPHLVTKLIKRDILVNTQFVVDNRIVIGEDAAVVYPSILMADKVCISDICGYHYVQHPGSMTRVAQKNENQIYDILFDHLEASFRNCHVWNNLEFQIKQYKKYLLFMRNMRIFDKHTQNILAPYGGISREERIIIYGAGGLGQMMYRYLRYEAGVDVVLWVDRNYENYQKKGMNVSPVSKILEIGNYDCILVANTMQTSADSIRQQLIDMGINNDLIRWFTDDFIKA